MNYSIGSELKKTKKGKDLVFVKVEDIRDYFGCNNGDHDIYKCPFCDERGHTADFKLYINNLTGIGFCFKCEIVVSLTEELSLENEADKYTRKTKFKSKVIPDKDYQIMEWTTPALQNDTVRNYLMNERKVKYSEERISEYDLRAAVVSGNNILIIPDVIDDNGCTKFFQYKNLSAQYSGPKYISVEYPNLMWISKCKNRLVIVEGAFDALATCSVPMMGKKISEHQHTLLRQYFLDKMDEKLDVYIAFDGDVGSDKLRETAEEVKSICHDNHSVYYVNIPDEMDPEEYQVSHSFDELLSVAIKV